MGRTPANPDGVGDLHRGRIAAVAPAMSGAFVALADNQTGFLPESEASESRAPIAKAVHEGMILPLRITRAAQGGKGPRVTARITPEDAARIAAASAGAPRLVARGPDAATRLATRHPRAAIIVDDLALAARLRGAFGDRVRHQHAPAFDDALEAAFDELAGPEVPLPGGGRLLVHPTPALVAIDMDAGSAAGARGPGAVAALNLEALPVLARQIRARNLAGPILVDFAGLSPRAAHRAGRTAEGGARVRPAGAAAGLHEARHGGTGARPGAPAAARGAGLAGLTADAGPGGAAPGGA